MVGPGDDPAQSPRDQAGDLSLGWGTGVARPPERVYLPKNTICILDLFHVLERLWKVAWCFFEEKTQKREAHQWVEERLKRLLEGKVDSVIRGLRYQTTQRSLKGQKRKTVLDAAGYYAQNRDRMKYDEYLAAGYPIGSGVVEGACRHLVKSAWSVRGCASSHQRQAMLDLRATYLTESGASGDCQGGDVDGSNSA